MKESDWLACDDPAVMLRHLTHEAREAPDAVGDHPRAVQPSDRKLRLWVCACVRSGGPLAGKDAVDVPAIERLADADASEDQYREIDGLLMGTGADWARRWAARKVTGGDPRAALLRDVFGNPFRPWPRVVRSGNVLWGLNPVTPLVPLTPTVLRLARGAYDGRDFAALPILADALEEAGCKDGPLLWHLRGQYETAPEGWYPTGPHTRGCWALDLILGRE